MFQFSRDNTFLISAGNLFHKVQAATLNTQSPYDLRQDIDTCNSIRLDEVLKWYHQIFEYLSLCKLHYSNFVEGDWRYNRICHLTRSKNSLYKMYHSKKCFLCQEYFYTVNVLMMVVGSSTYWYMFIHINTCQK